MRHDDALSVLYQSPRLLRPVQPKIWDIDPCMNDTMPMEPVTIEHTLHGETLTLTAPLARLAPGYKNRMVLSIDGEEGVLWAKDDLLRPLLELAGHLDDPARYPADTHSLILDHLTRPLLEALANTLEADKVEVLEYHGEIGTEQPGKGGLAMSVSLPGRFETRLLITAPDTMLQRFAHVLTPPDTTQKPASPRINTAGIEFACSLFAPEFEIDPKDLACLQTNDVMVLEARWLESGAFRLCVADTLAATVSRDGDALHLRSDFELYRRKNTMARDPGTVASLPVTVSIELARKSITLDELQGVGVGDILDFADASLDTVSLTANGREVGSGVLVRSGDQIGIRLISVA